MSINSAERRLQVLGQHLAPSGELELGVLARHDTAASTSTASASSVDGGASTPYASIDGRPNSYSRVHGVASRAPARWRLVPTVAREDLTDVKYEKAEGEGIAKVRGRLALQPDGNAAWACGIRRRAAPLRMLHA
jgi:naphthoate synthase